MGLFKKDEDLDFFETNHTLIVYDEDTRMCTIHTITSITDDAVIAAGKHSIEKTMCSVHAGENGLIYTFQAPSNIVTETERLAKLEKSIVLQQLTQYEEPMKDNPNLDMRFWGMVVLLFVAIIAAAF